MAEKKTAKKKLPWDLRYTQNRELSWLQFNRRVLEEAEDKTNPLYERLKFVAIFQSNLDEFFMIRVGSLTDIAALGKDDKPDSKSGLTAAEQLKQIYARCRPYYAQRDKIFAAIEEKLAGQKVRRLARKEMDALQRRYADKWFKNYVLPILSPQIVDPRHPFPHLNNNQLHLILTLKNKAEDQVVMGLLPVPASLPPFLALPGPAEELDYTLIPDLLLEKLPRIFPGFRVQSKAVIKVTRNADISPDDEAFDMDDDYRDVMRRVLKKRGRLAPVRLEYQGRLPKPVLKSLCQRLSLDSEQVYASRCPLDLGYVFALSARLPDPAALSYVPFSPQPSPKVAPGQPMLEQITQKDLLLHYPYESMDPFLRLLRESARDPNVVSMKITIYRLSSKSRIVDYLCQAAENGKDVTVLMELKARFDEQNNIEWAQRLEEAGCHLLYGFEDLKVHSKLCLITRITPDGVERFTQVGTGNYNEKTSAQYTDFSLMTADREIGEDADLFFKNMALANPEGEYRALWVAPNSFKSRIMELLDREIQKAENGQPCRVRMKLNSLSDRTLIDKLSQASQAGVPIDLIVRGICCLVPGRKGCTEHIRVRSIVGRFLEHSRVYSFGVGKDEVLYIGSADLMTRNMSKRVEVACPVRDPEAARRIHHVLDLQLSDNVRARVLDQDGVPVPVPAEKDAPRVDAQQTLMEEALQP